MSDIQVTGYAHLLGEQIEKLMIGGAGRRNDDGSIAAVLGKEGHVFFGPYLELPPGPYSVRMIFAAELPPESETDDPGIVLEAVWGERIIASFPLDEVSLEAGVVALPFEVPAAGPTEGSRLEIRIYSQGKTPLSASSIDLRRMTFPFRRPSADPSAQGAPPAAGEGPG
jgi:hypothetical protein